MGFNYIAKKNLTEYIYKNPYCSILNISKNLKMNYVTTFVYIKELIKIKEVIKHPKTKRMTRLTLNPILKNQMDWIFYIKERYKRTGKLTAPPKLR